MFKNREHAAQLLVEKLRRYRNKNAVVIAVPRGGVPIGVIVSEALNLPLEIFLAKKIGHPANPEYAIGSVALDGTMKIGLPNNVSESYIKEETERIHKILTERKRLFAGDRVPLSLTDKVIIVVDDGIATGNTLEVIITSIKKQKPEKIVIAVPVAPVETAERFRQLADEFICLETPVNFMSVGQFYVDFAQVSDDDVVQLLRMVQSRETK